MAKSSLVSETIMFSVNVKGKGEVVVHHLPYPRDSVLLETYLKRGFTFERPLELLKLQDIIEAEKMLTAADVPTGGRRLHDGKKVVAVSCSFPGCQFVAKSESGLSVHQRKHKKEA